MTAARAATEAAALLSAVPNFRDAGGRLADSGRAMRRGVVYRSSQLFGLPAAAQQDLLALGVTDVFDLRTAGEVEHRPDSLPGGIRLVVDDVLADRPHSGAAEVASIVNDHAERASVERINAAVGDGRAKQLMLETYRHFVTLPSAHRAYRGLLTGVAHATGPAVIHCTAGKDRSGWAVAVLQLVAGVPMPDVMADYLLSNEPMTRAYGSMLDGFAAEGGDAASLSHMIFVEPDYLAEALSVVATDHGGLPGYLGGALGLTTSDLDRLRDRLLR